MVSWPGIVAPQVSWFNQEESGGDRYAARIWIGEGEPFQGELHYFVGL
jgi:hypothetical protein